MDSCAVWFGFFCFCKQKTAYEMRISDWSSDVCSSDLAAEWRGMREQPFVYVFGRTHFAVSYFGANVFPETVAIGLEQPDIAPHVTGKFVLQAHEGIDTAPHLALAIELAPGAAAIDPDSIADAVLAQLLRLNSEFKNYTPPEYQHPRVTLHPAGDPDWFPVGVQHRYTRR